jgi:acyl carrier protein
MTEKPELNETLARVAGVVSAELSCDATTIGVDTTADDVDGWDSLAHARLIMKIEETFDVRFPGNRLFDLDCVGDLVSLVDDCCSAKGMTDAPKAI